jgi:hypothetical protein
MTCVHLQKLYQLCLDSKIRVSSSDLVNMVCEECGVKEECPSVLLDEYEHREQTRPPVDVKQQTTAKASQEPGC